MTSISVDLPFAPSPKNTKNFRKAVEGIRLEGREEFAAGRPTPEEAKAAILSYFAYFGTFSVNEAEGTVIHHREAHLIPNRITDGPRVYQFSGNRLRLTTPPIMNGIIQTLTWERIE